MTRLRPSTLNDAHEISLDENITREAMHPADQFEAFRKLAEERGYGPEEIGARFGVSAHVVRQRLRLPTVLRVAPPEQDGDAEAGEASLPDAPASGNAEGLAPTDDGYAFAAE